MTSRLLALCFLLNLSHITASTTIHANDFVITGLWRYSDSGKPFGEQTKRDDQSRAYAISTQLAISDFSNRNFRFSPTGLERTAELATCPLNFTIVNRNTESISMGLISQYRDAYNEGHLHAILGPTTSGETATLGLLAAVDNVPVLSGSATSVALDDLVYSSFLRTIAADNAVGEFSIRIMSERGYKHVGMLFSDSSYGSSIAIIAQDKAAENDVVLYTEGFLEGSQDSVNAAMERLKARNVNAFIGVTGQVAVPDIFEAQRLSEVHGEGFFWLYIEAFKEYHYDPIGNPGSIKGFHGSAFMTVVPGFDDSTPFEAPDDDLYNQFNTLWRTLDSDTAFKATIEGNAFQYFAQDISPFPNGTDLSKYDDDHFEKATLPIYAGFFYDAAMTLALSACKLHSTGVDPKTNGKLLTELIKGQTTSGLSGDIIFDKWGSRAPQTAKIAVSNYLVVDTLLTKTLAYTYPNSDLLSETLFQNTSHVFMFSDGSNIEPPDRVVRLENEARRKKDREDNQSVINGLLMGGVAVMIVVLAVFISYLVFRRKARVDVRMSDETKLSPSERLQILCNERVRSQRAWLSYEIIDTLSDVTNGILVLVERNLPSELLIPFVVVAALSLYAGYSSVETRTKVIFKYKKIAKGDRKLMLKYEGIFRERSQQNTTDENGHVTQAGQIIVSEENLSLKKDLIVLEISSLSTSFRNGFIEDIPSFTINIASIMYSVNLHDFKASIQFYVSFFALLISCVTGGRKTYLKTKIKEMKETKRDYEFEILRVLNRERRLRMEFDIKMGNLAEKVNEGEGGGVVGGENGENVVIREDGVGNEEINT